MDSTQSTLLDRVRDPADASAWREFYGLYAPLLYRFARARGLSRQDAEEIRDECLAVLARKLPTFDYARDRGGFKNWLWTMVVRKVIDQARKRRDVSAKTSVLRRVKTREPSPEEVWEKHWLREHLKYCVDRVRGDVSEQNYAAFRMLMLEEATVPEICKKLGVNRNQVYKAKARVLQRVREQMLELGVE